MAKQDTSKTSTTRATPATPATPASKTADTAVPAAPVPNAAVGQVTVETKTPDGDVSVNTVPAAQARAAQEAETPAPRVVEATPRVVEATPRVVEATPRAARRTTRRQRKATPTVQRRSRDQRTRQTPQRAARPLRDTTPQERTVTLTLPAHQWERMDRLIKRTQRSEGDFFRHLLSPYLR